MADDPRTLLAQADRAFRASRFKDCLDICRGLLERDAANAEALFLVAQAAQGAGDNGLADRAYRMLTGLQPLRSEHWLSYATFLHRYRLFDVAEDLLHELLAAMPTLNQGWHLLGLCQFGKGSFDEALEAARRSCQIAPERSEGWELAAAALQRSGDLAGAIETCRQGLGRVQRAGRLHYSLGQLLRQDCAFAEAADAYRAAEGAGFSSPDLYRNLAAALMDSGNLDDAVASASRGIAAYPQHAGVHRTLARLRHASAAPGDPLADLRAAARSARSNPELWQTLVEFQKRLGHEDEASEALIEARRSGCPDTPGILALESMDAARLGRSEEARAGFESILKKAPKNRLVQHAYIETLVRLGDFERARHLGEAVIAEDAFDQIVLAYLGILWRLLGDEREAWLLDYDRMVVQVPVAAPGGMSRDAFFEDLRGVLDGLHNSNAHPIEQSVRGGTQTNGYLFRLRHERLADLERELRRAIASAVQGFPQDDAHPFWSRRHRAPTGDGLRFAGAWSVRLRSQGFHTNHIHPEGWISSAFYVGLPREVREASDTSGFIQFGAPMSELGLDLPPRRLVQPEVGTLVLFPSYMWHGTVPFQSDEARTTVAFDLLPDR
ncbi:MAG: putative 2OG-Fe(II) oxygenase [Halieaceae bacterium]|nr:putative 2OG-Fe(II) oxygenase [Halieaceae bacterium]